MRRLNPHKIIGDAIAVASILGGISVAFYNPEMTQVQLLLSYWPVYVMVLAGILSGVVIAEIEDDTNDNEIHLQ